MAPNSPPINKKPSTRNSKFSAMVMADTGSGIKLASTMARPDTLPTDNLLGTRKKNTAAATIAVPSVMMPHSASTAHIFALLFRFMAFFSFF